MRDPFGEYLGMRCHRCCDLGDHYRHTVRSIRRDRPTTVEAEPADSQERGSDYRQDNIVGSEVLAFVSDPFLQNDGGN